MLIRRSYARGGAFFHRLPVQIRFNDVDRYGHVNNNAYFAYYDLGKQEYLYKVLKLITAPTRWCR